MVIAAIYLFIGASIVPHISGNDGNTIFANRGTLNIKTIVLHTIMNLIEKNFPFSSFGKIVLLNVSIVNRDISSKEFCAGYTLYSTPSPRASPDQHATLIDMDGNIIHEWSITGFPAKMLPGGSLLGSKTVRDAIHQDTIDFVQESWSGQIEWSFNSWDDDNTGIMMSRQHHDYQREGNPVGYFSPGQNFVSKGKTLILAHYNEYVKNVSREKIRDDVIYEVDWNGNLTGFEWHASDHIEEMGFNFFARIGIYFFPGTNIFLIRLLRGDWLHVNSVSLLGKNHWYDEGDERFHPENIVIDSREANIIAIICRETGKIIWRVGPSYSKFYEEGRKLGQIIGPHHAHMIPEGLPGEGNILVFDNGGTAGYGLLGMASKRRFFSRVIEFDPITLDIVWEYTQKNFYSALVSSAQRLPNGNTLITEGCSGRIFEVTVDNEIVWEFVSESKDIFGKNLVYRAYRIPPEWVPENPAGYEHWEKYNLTEILSFEE